jgi:hypothetical protein
MRSGTYSRNPRRNASTQRGTEPPFALPSACHVLTIPQCPIRPRQHQYRDRPDDRRAACTGYLAPTPPAPPENSTSLHPVHWLAVRRLLSEMLEL